MLRGPIWFHAYTLQRKVNKSSGKKAGFFAAFIVLLIRRIGCIVIKREPIITTVHDLRQKRREAGAMSSICAG
jgi:hypothetical protein